jgi:hypothetical protein
MEKPLKFNPEKKFCLRKKILISKEPLWNHSDEPFKERIEIKK